MVALHILQGDSAGLPVDIGDNDLVLALPEGAALLPDAHAAIEQVLGPVDALFGDIDIAGVVQHRAAWSPTRAVTDPTAVLPMATRAAILRSLGVAPADPGLALALAAASIEVSHLPRVLTTHATPPVAPTLERLEEHLRSLGVEGHIESNTRVGTFRIVPNEDFSPRITIVIPTAGSRLPDDHPSPSASAVEACLASLAGSTSSVDVVLVVGDEFDGDTASIAVPSGLDTQLVTRPPGPFNFSAAINLGLLAATGDLVLLLNDDTEALDPSFLAAMAVHFADPTVGAVGATLQYPNGNLQHGGMIIDDAHPLHPFVNQDPAAFAAHGGDVARDVIAVTGACLMARRRDLLAVGGLSTDFPLSFNDGDLCLRIRRGGQRVIIEPAAVLVHHETLTRAPVIDPWEWDRWIHRWGEVVDPWYHPAFHRPDDPTDLRRNADHLAPHAVDLERLAADPPLLRTTRLRSRVHRGRHAPTVT